MANRVIQVVLKAIDELSGPLKKTEQGIVGFGQRVTGVFKAIGALAVTAALGKLFRDAIGEAAQAEKGIARLGVAVTNAGGDFQRLRPQMEQAVKGVQRLTTATDDDLRAALTNLTTITSDVQGSMRNLGLVTDLAAFKQISLEEASTLVARAMVGNVTQLNRMGFAGKDATGVLESLRAAVGGFAEREANTFSGRLQRLNNQWGEFKEALGTALLASGDMGQGVGRLTGLLVNLEDWVTRNSDSISGFVGTLVDGTGKLARLLGEVLEKIGAVIRFTPPQLIGKLLGVDLAKGWEQAGKALKSLGEAVAKGEQATTTAVATGARERTRISAGEAADREADAKRLARELERINHELAVRLLQLDQNLTEQQAEEMVRRREILTGEVRTIVTEITEGWRQLDRANVLLAAGLDKILPKTTGLASTLKGVTTQLKAAPPAKPIAAAAKEASVFNRELLDAARGAIGAGQTLGILDDRMASIGQNAITFAENIGKATAGNPAGIIAAVGSLTGVLGSLFGESPTARARKALLEANTRALEENTNALELQTPGGQVAGAEAALSSFLTGKSAQNAEIQEAIRQLTQTGTLTPGTLRALAGVQADVSDLAPLLFAQGLGIGDLEDLAKDLGIQIRNPESGKIEVKALFQLLQAIRGIQPGFGPDIASQLERIDTGLGIGAIAPENELAEILGVIRTQGAESPAINQALGAFFASGERSDAISGLRDLFNRIASGQVGQGSFGALTQQQTLDLIERLMGLFTSEQGFALPTLSGSLGATGAAPQFGDLFGVQSGTPNFTGALSGTLASESVDLLGSIDDKMGRLLDALTQPGTPFQIQVQTTAGAPSGEATDQALFRTVRRIQLANGIVLRSL